MKKVMLIASGGGHFTELKQFSRIIESNNCLLVTEKASNTKDSEYNTKFLKHISRSDLFYWPIYFYNSFLSAIYFFGFNPQVVISTGAHTTIPTMLLAKIFKKKLIYVETYANVYKPTRTGKFIYKHCDLFIVQWEEMLKHYPNAVYGGSIF